MPVFTEVGPEARERLVKKTKGYQDRQVYRDMLTAVFVHIEPASDGPDAPVSCERVEEAPSPTWLGWGRSSRT